MDANAYNWENFWGHEKQLKALTEDLETKNLPHAYLFAGPGKIGKFTLAKRLAKILQCEKEGCGMCPDCLNIEKGYHPDTIEIHDDGETIKVEPMRDILARLATTTPGKYRILLVKNIERMTPETANVMLKTIEEPPSKVIFLFTSSRPESVLPTILSRVRPVKFHSLVVAHILAHLSEKHPLESREKLQKIADLSFGLPGRAINFMGNEELFSQTEGLFERVKNILKQGDIVEKFALVTEMTQDEDLFQEFFDIFLLALRYTMLEAAELFGTPGGHSPQKLRRTLEAVTLAQDAVRLQKRNVNARLLFENLMLRT